MGATEKGGSADVLFDLRELRVVGGNDHIASQRELQSCSYAKTLYGADDRYVHPFHSRHHRDSTAQHPSRALAVDADESRLDVYAAAEVVAFGLHQESSSIRSIDLVENIRECRK